MSEQSLDTSIVRILTNRGQVVGMGFLVGERQILTCAHVVTSVLGLVHNAQEKPTDCIRLDFPFQHADQIITAHVDVWHPGEDIAVLELDGFPPPDAQPVHLIAEDNLWEDKFRAFGFPDGHENGVWSTGVLRSRIVNNLVQIEAIDEFGYFIQPGFSGSPVWDEPLNGVVGMVAAADKDPGTKAAFIIPVNRLVSVWPKLSQIVVSPVTPRKEKESIAPRKEPATPRKEPAILVIGSGVGENVLILKPDTEIQLGLKHRVERKELYGGSGLNYAFRLAHTGHYALPILSIGRDRIGRKVQEELSKLAQHNEQIVSFVNDADFGCSGISTPQSTVIVARELRTIFTQELQGIQHFERFAHARMKRLIDLDQIMVKAVMIGHIHADSPVLNPGQKGEVTKGIIEKYSKEDVIIYTNFGESQYSLGNSFWQDTLKKVTIFQLSLSEVRKFFGQDDSVSSLRQIIEWFQGNNITAVITMEKFGAIATFKNERHGVIFAWPFELENFADSTGAGDAFGAGLIAKLYQEYSKDEISFEAFQSAIKQGRIWAAYACTKFGAANECPDNKTLVRFKNSLIDQKPNFVETQDLRDCDRILRLLDKVY